MAIQNPGDLLGPRHLGDELPVGVEVLLGHTPGTDEELQAGGLRIGVFIGLSDLRRLRSARARFAGRGPCTEKCREREQRSQS